MTPWPGSDWVRGTKVIFAAIVTNTNGKDYVAPAKRIVTVDNDGTLWVEYPMYTQALFASVVSDRD